MYMMLKSMEQARVKALATRAGDQNFSLDFNDGRREMPSSGCLPTSTHRHTQAHTGTHMHNEPTKRMIDVIIHEKIVVPAVSALPCGNEGRRNSKPST